MEGAAFLVVVERLLDESSTFSFSCREMREVSVDVESRAVARAARTMAGQVERMKIKE